MEPTISKEYDAELAMQGKCFQWHWNTYPNERGRLFHVNGKAKNRIEGSKFKAIGVVPGVADLGYMVSGGRTIWIEMKTPVGSQSPEQKRFQQQVEELGGIYLICRNLETFKEIINYYQN